MLGIIVLKYISSRVSLGRYDVLLRAPTFLEKEALKMSTWKCQESSLSIVTPRQLVEVTNFTKPEPQSKGYKGPINCYFASIIASDFEG